MSEKVLYTEEQIAKRLAQLATEIAEDYQGKTFLLVGILKGSVVIIADLMRALFHAGCHDFELSFITLRSYVAEEISSRNVSLIQDIDRDVHNKDILLVDDIFDSGKSFQFVAQLFTERGATSITGFALLSKPARHTGSYKPKYIGFEVPNVWVEGYGMDTNEKGRGNPSVIVDKTNE